MLILSKDEEKTIKNWKALPISVIERRFEELKDELRKVPVEDFLSVQKFTNELERWLQTIKVFYKPKKIKKKDNFI